MNKLIQKLYIPGISKSTLLALACVFVGSVGLDQVSKTHMQETMIIYQDQHNTDFYRGRLVPLTYIGRPKTLEQPTSFYVALNFHYSRNKGAAFSMFESVEDRYRVPFFYGVTCLAVILIFMYLQTTPPGHHLTRYGLIMILSGAIGNFIDRLRYGYVVDFIDVDWDILGWEHDFAIFNVADVAINIGVICLLLDVLVQYLRSRNQADGALAAGAELPQK